MLGLAEPGARRREQDDLSSRVTLNSSEAERLRSAASTISGTVGPIVAVAREQAHALLIFLNDQPIAVMLDFMYPIPADRNLRGAGWNAGLEWAAGHAGNIGFAAKIWSPARWNHQRADCGFGAG